MSMATTRVVKMQWKRTGRIMDAWTDPFVTRSTRGHRRGFCLVEWNIGYVGRREAGPGLDDVGDSMIAGWASIYVIVEVDAEEVR